MSSSRRSLPADGSTSRGACPTCGSRRVVATVEDVVIRARRRSHRFASVPHERCLACGERIFSIDVSRQFDAAILKRRRAA